MDEVQDSLVSESSSDTASGPSDVRPPREIKLSDIVEMVQSGVTRCKDDSGYTAERGSIQEKYELTKTEVAHIFKHDKIKGLRFRPYKAPTYTIVDDIEDKPELVAPGYGAKSATQISREEAATATPEPAPPTAETPAVEEVTPTSSDSLTSATAEPASQESENQIF